MVLQLSLIYGKYFQDIFNSILIQLLKCIVITEVVDSPEHKQDTNQGVDGGARTMASDLSNEILAQTSEVGEYQIYVKNDNELLISEPVPSKTVNEDVNYPTLESSLNSASIYLGQKNRSN